METQLVYCLDVNVVFADEVSPFCGRMRSFNNDSPRFVTVVSVCRDLVGVRLSWGSLGGLVYHVNDGFLYDDGNVCAGENTGLELNGDSVSWPLPLNNSVINTASRAIDMSPLASTMPTKEPRTRAARWMHLRV